MKLHFPPAIWALFLPLVCAAADGSAQDGRKLYREQIFPLLQKNCLACHGTNAKQAGLDLSNREALLRGGDDGAVVVPGDPEASRLYKLVTHTRQPGMPLNGKKLPDEALAQFAAWIKAGVPFDSTATAGEAAPAAHTHWAFRSPLHPAPPAVKNRAWIRNPIDAFILAEQENRGLAPASEADSRTLLRRVYLDLIGLPPTAAEIKAFEADHAKDAYERVVDRLLASPRYGERWARQWMDVWRYSDWSGNRKNQDLRSSQRHIWRWRDWIVESLNENKGYDRMVMEMFAGDELASGDPKVLAATGYLARSYFFVNRNTWLQDTVEYTAASFLGLTMKCARCHTHKYDPIPQTDYYRLRAFFEPYDVRIDRVAGEVDTLKNGLARAYDADAAAPTYRFLGGNEQSPDTANPLEPGIPGLFGKVDLKIEPVTLPLEAYYPDSRKFVQDDLITAAKSDISTAEAELAKARESDVTLAQKTLVAAQAYLVALQARVAADNAAHALAASQSSGDVERLAAEARKLERTANGLKAEEQLMRAQLALEAMRGQEGKDADKRRAAAQKEVKAALDGLTHPDDSYTTVGKVYPTSSTGRRLALARWLTGKQNPLTARVAINHIWLRHFGSPLVPVVWNFGVSGKPPTHPELLDWLATEFMAGNWDMKAMHRLMVTSSAYRMASTPELAPPGCAAIDPSNRYLWHMNAHRMEAEVVRDSLLYISGKLDLTMGGAEIDETKAEESHRRGLYFRHAQGYQAEFLEAFDAASPLECFQRKVSVVPQQALALANSRIALTAARDLSQQLNAKLIDQTKFVQGAFEAILGRLPDRKELAECLSFLDSQTKLYQEGATLKPAGTAKLEPVSDPASRARESLVRVMFNHNDFVTVR